MSHIQFRTEILRNPKTGLFVLVSPDLKGLYVHARTEEELYRKALGVVRALMAAEGKLIGEIRRIDELAPFEKPSERRFDAELVAA